MNPFLQARQPTVRMQLPPGMSRSVSARGFTFEADTDGVLTVPRDVAAELQYVVSASGSAPSGRASFAEEVEKIHVIDARLLELYAEKARFEAAVKRAEEMGAGSGGASVAAVQELQGKRRRTIVDVLLGRAKQADLDGLELQRKEADARLAEESYTRELAALGLAELREQHIFPLEREASELGAQRAIAVRRAIRSRAETAAVEYRSYMQACANSFGVLQAYASVLAELERVGTSREDTSVGKQSFHCFMGNTIRNLPACPELGAFKGSAYEVQVSFDVADIRAQVRQLLTKDGLMA